MSKKKTSNKPDHPLNYAKPIKFNQRMKFEHQNPNEWLKKKENVRKALWECILTNDLTAFKEILKAHLSAVNKTNLSEISGIPRRTIYRMLAPKSNPTFSNISRLLSLVF